MLNWRSFKEQTMDSDAFEFNIYNGFNGNPFRTLPSSSSLPSPPSSSYLIWQCVFYGLASCQSSSKRLELRQRVKRHTHDSVHYLHRPLPPTRENTLHWNLWKSCVVKFYFYVQLMETHPIAIECEGNGNCLSWIGGQPNVCRVHVAWPAVAPLCAGAHRCRPAPWVWPREWVAVWAANHSVDGSHARRPCRRLRQADPPWRRNDTGHAHCCAHRQPPRPQCRWLCQTCKQSCHVHPPFCSPAPWHGHHHRGRSWRQSATQRQETAAEVGVASEWKVDSWMRTYVFVHDEFDGQLLIEPSSAEGIYNETPQWVQCGKIYICTYVYIYMYVHIYTCSVMHNLSMYWGNNPTCILYYIHYYIHINK